MKDYYDIYYLANKFDVDGKILTDALKKTFANRNRSFTLEQFEQMVSFSGDDAMQKKWAAFCKKINTKNDFDNTLSTISRFLYYPFKATVENREFTKLWSVNIQEWI